jgi:teichoic acid ribitol-phosphate primase
MKGWLVSARAWLVRLAFAIGRRRSIRPRVVLATSHLDHLGGNLASIAAELAAQHHGIEVVTLTSRPRQGWRGPLAAIVPAIKAGYHLATARVFIVDDHFFPIYAIRPRRGTTIVQTWHGSGAFKKFGYSVLDKAFGADAASDRRVRMHRGYDVCLVSSTSAAVHFAEAFRLPIERFRSDLGIPRTDVLFGEERIARTVAALRQRYAIPADRRVVLYAPTFRGDSVMAAHATDDLDLGAMRAALGADHVLLVKLHPFVRAAAPIAADLTDFAIDVSDHPDINELLLIADVLVTDYSSVIYEFSLLGRPMVFFAPDYVAYEEERGFYFDYRTGVPGPIAESTEAVIELLRAGTFDLARVETFRRASFDIADGRSTSRFIEALVRPVIGS